MAVRCAFSRFGSGSSGGTPVTVLHGLFGTRLNWRTLANRMARMLDRPVYTLDARNHGESPHVPEMNYKLMGQDLLQFFQEQCLDRTVLIGHSMGGKTAMHTALSRPEVVEKLVVVDVAPCTAPGTGESNDIIRALKQLNLNQVKSRRDADILLKERIPDHSLRQFLLTNLVSVAGGGSLRWRVNLDAVERYVDELKGFPYFEGTFPAPTLFVGGANSNYITSRDLPDIRRLFPKARVEHVPDAGHWVHFEKPDHFLHLVTKFITQNT